MKVNLPLSKSWAIRMIFLDMLYGFKTKYRIIRYFQKTNVVLADDVRVALRCAETYLNKTHLKESIYN